MAFSPFGYRFDVRSRMRPEEAKAALRAAKKGWFETKNGPRGWILGPFLCLWASAFDRRGPMLIGRISDDNLGTRVRGRAGSDLNGVGLAALYTPVVGILLYHLFPGGTVSFRQGLLYGCLAGLFLLG